MTHFTACWKLQEPLENTDPRQADHLHAFCDLHPKLLVHHERYLLPCYNLTQQLALSSKPTGLDPWKLKGQSPSDPFIAIFAV